jgi:hypothetical protein
MDTRPWIEGYREVTEVEQHLSLVLVKKKETFQEASSRPG